jgi:hypothetical protein
VEVDSEDVTRRMKPVADRLAIVPSWAAVEDMDMGPSGFREPGSRVAGTGLHKHEHQGFKIRMRRHAGAGEGAATDSGPPLGDVGVADRPFPGSGHRLFRCVTKISKRGLYGITVLESGKRGTLRARFYNHLTSREQEIRLTPLERACLLHSASGSDWRFWKKRFLHRLMLRSSPANPDKRAINPVGTQGWDGSMRRDYVGLDRRVYTKALRRKESGDVLRVALYLGHRGTEVLAVFTLNGTRERYTKVLPWELLLKAKGLSIRKTGYEAEDTKAICDFVAGLEHAQRRVLFEQVGACAR